MKAFVCGLTTELDISGDSFAEESVVLGQVRSGDEILVLSTGSMMPVGDSYCRADGGSGAEELVRLNDNGISRGGIELYVSFFAWSNFPLSIVASSAFGCGRSVGSPLATPEFNCVSGSGEPASPSLLLTTRATEIGGLAAKSSVFAYSSLIICCIFFMDSLSKSLLAFFSPKLPGPNAPLEV